MYFYNPTKRQIIKIAPGILGRTFWGDRLMLAFVDLDAYAVLSNHSHPHEQGGIMISGEMELTIAGESRTIRPGDMYIIPGGTEHSARVGSQPVQVLDIFTPAREDLKY